MEPICTAGLVTDRAGTESGKKTTDAWSPYPPRPRGDDGIYLIYELIVTLGTALRQWGSRLYRLRQRNHRA
jgi:hypothetical protein